MRSALVDDGYQRGRIVGFAAAAIVLLSATSHAVGAQGCASAGTIAADRPGFLSGPVVLAKGSVQVESGWAMTRQSEGTAHAIGATMLRIPVGCTAELRFAAGGYLFDRSPTGVTTSGLTDGYLGTKIRLARGSGLRPQLALFTGSGIPLGGAFSQRRAEPEMALSALWDLPVGQSVLAFAGFASRVADGDSRETERIAGASWAFPLGARAASFIELAEFVRHDEHIRYLTTGLQLFPHATLQLDGFVSVPLPRAGSDLAIGVGVARRW